MARMLDDEFYNVQRNILDKVTDKSVNNDELKGIVAMFGLDVFKRLIDRKQNVLDSNIEEIKTQGTIRAGRNQELFKRRNVVLENDKEINLIGENKFFDGQAESVFMNPKTHLNTLPDFNPDEFKDSTSPMYKVKQKWKQDYINQVLLPQHKNKYNQIDQSILTFDEYNNNNRELTKHAVEYAKRPEQRSIVRQWNLFGKKRTAKLKENYDVAKTEQENTMLEREGYLIHNRIPTLNSIDSQTGDTFGSTEKGTRRIENNLIVKPLSGLTKKMYKDGEVYNEFEFRNTDNYKNLSLQGQSLANELFKTNVDYKDPNNSYELLNIFTTVQLLEEEQKKQSKYETIKYNDSEYSESKPIRKKTQSRTMYEESEEYKTWKEGVDLAYEKGTAKDISAREEAGYNLTRSEVISKAVEENLDYFPALREAKRFNSLEVTDENYLSDAEYLEKVNEFKRNTISNVVSKELNTNDKLQDFIIGIQEDRTSRFLDSLKTSRGEQNIEDWLTVENQTRKANNMKLIPPSEARTIYGAIQIKSIIDDTAMMQSFLVLTPENLIGLDPEKEKEYIMSSDFN